MTIRIDKQSLKFGMWLIFTFLISFNCYSQHHNKDNKYLFLQCTTEPKTRVIKTGRHVSISFYHTDNILRGNLDSISDTAIFIKGYTVPLNDIKTISSLRMKAISGLGCGVDLIFSYGLIISALGAAAGSNSAENKIGFELFCIYSGTAIIIGGIINIFAIKHYHLDKDYKLTVKNSPII